MNYPSNLGWASFGAFSFPAEEAAVESSSCEEEPRKQESKEAFALI